MRVEKDDVRERELRRERNARYRRSMSERKREATEKGHGELSNLLLSSSASSLAAILCRMLSKRSDAVKVYCLLKIAATESELAILRKARLKDADTTNSAESA